MGGSYWAHSFIVLAAAAPSTCKIFKCQFSGVQRISRFAGRFTFKVRGTGKLRSNFHPLLLTLLSNLSPFSFNCRLDAYYSSQLVDK